MAGNKGQSVLEILIALGVIIVSVSAASMIFFGAQSSVVDAQLSGEAAYLAKEAIETARAEARGDFNSLTSSSSTKNEFLTETTIEDVDDNTKRVTTRVSWQTDPLREQEVELVTYVTRWRDVVPPPDTGDTGGGGLSGDWQNPRTLGSIDLGPGNQATDLDVVNKIVYISAEASAAAKPDFFIIDATDGQNPFIVSSINTGPSLNAVDASLNYAYVGNREADRELQIINISNPSSPSLIVSYAVPGIDDSSSKGTAVFYTNNKVYLGTNKVVGPEFHIIDVSNPGSPQLLGSYEVDDNVNDIYVRDGRAYLATDLGGAGLIILGIDNPSSITFLGQGFSSDTNSVVNINGSLTVIGPAQDFYTVDTSNPANITTLGSINIGNIMNDMINRDYLVFLATSNSNREFQVINISNPNNPTLHSFFNFSQVATGVDYEDNLVYVSVRSNDALRIITSSP